MRKQLLIILPTLAAGGTTRIVMSVSRRLMESGWSITLTTLFPTPDAPVSPVEPGMTFAPLVPAGRRRQIKALFGLTRLARAHDVVLAAQEIAATNYGWLASMIACRPFISWTHVAYSRLGSLLPPGHDSIARWVYRRAQCIVFPSEGAAESLAQALRCRRPPHWWVIPNFIELPTPEASTSWRSEWDPWFRRPVLLTVARLAPQKALDRLLRAHRSLLDRGIEHHLIIVGTGPEKGALEAEVERLGVGSTTLFAGHVDDPTPFYQKATVFGMCSRYEGFGLTLIEAMSAGLPVVAMDCESGPREVLDGGKAGVLTPDSDEGAFTDALAHLLTDDTARSHYAVLGRARAATYTSERIMPQWEDLLLRVTAKPSMP
ncbi:glycosyltransferase [Extensimonas perlucida]|uniref:glycosyltransferase n=1 Tax=Extensimonas perlucida TaxID=2590786 RepID=UPI0011A87F59|nr:glycosyltransferase [Extensimonas perlucida]